MLSQNWPVGAPSGWILCPKNVIILWTHCFQNEILQLILLLHGPHYWINHRSECLYPLLLICDPLVYMTGDVCIYTYQTQKQTNKQCTLLYLFLYLSTHWKSWVHTETPNSNTTVQCSTSFSHFHMWNFLLQQWKICLTLYWIYLLIWSISIATTAGSSCRHLPPVLEPWHTWRHFLGQPCLPCFGSNIPNWAVTSCVDTFLSMTGRTTEASSYLLSTTGNLGPL